MAQPHSEDASGILSGASSGAITTATTAAAAKTKEAGFGGWLQRVRRTGEFSDITVRVNDDEFRLHMLPLRNASSFFRNLKNNDGEEEEEQHSQEEYAEIRDLPGGTEAFSTAADFCYLIKPQLTFDTVAAVRAAAEHLGMPDLLDATKRFLYASVFSHWRSCVAFLERFKRMDATVDSYIETRCLKVVATACTKAFTETKHVSVPIGVSTNPVLRTSSSTNSMASNKCGAAAASNSRGSLATCWQASPCHALTEIFVTVSSRLPDEYMEQLVDILVDAEVNLSVKCRQGRNVRAWLNHLLRDECFNDRGRCWILVCLTRMLIKSGGHGLELSSQYLCTLLEHAGEQADRLKTDLNRGLNTDLNRGLNTDLNRGLNTDLNRDVGPKQEKQEMLDRLCHVKEQLEMRIGSSLHELDDFLHSYRFPPDTLLSLVRNFVREHDDGVQRDLMEEVAAEVDGCLWAFAESRGSITAQEFGDIFSAFPACSRSSHDLLYASIERMIVKNNQNTVFGPDEVQSLWGLVDCDKLSPEVHEQALNNPSFLCQPHVLERVLRIHNEELASMGDGEQKQGDRKELRNIMQKVIKASLKLLEENSRRSKEILELQKQYATLLGGPSSGNGGPNRMMMMYRGDSSSCENSPDVFQCRLSKNNIIHKVSGAANAAVHPEDDHRDQEDDHDLAAMMMVAPQTPMVEARRSLHSLGDMIKSSS